MNGKVVEQFLRTTGNPSRIALRADRMQIRASRNDLSYVIIELQDNAGHPIEDGVAEIHFSVKGQGELAAVGSANPQRWPATISPIAGPFMAVVCGRFPDPPAKRGSSRSKRAERASVQAPSQSMSVKKPRLR